MNKVNKATIKDKQNFKPDPISRVFFIGRC